MCGRLHYGTNPTSVAEIGDPIPITNSLTDKSGMATWSGFTRQERQNWWEKEGNTIPISIDITTLIENTTEFRIPAGYRIRGLGLRRDILVQGKVIARAGTARIITRPPANSLERGIHSRWPVMTNSQGAQSCFINRDVVNGQMELT